MTRLVLAVLLGCALLAGCQASVVPPVADPVSSGSCTVVDGKADARCTPGASNPLVTQANIGQTICRKGWTATVRPPTSYTDPLKIKLMARYGITAPPSAVELDHLIALEIGGDPRAEANLWPEVWDGSSGAHVKDGRENAARKAVCSGWLTLVDAQRQMMEAWTHR